jgi:UDP:flavonoid glycosyltransferase YjiC (YdhE family)
MRLLFAFAGGQGHFDPLVPLARAAAAAGHDVAVAGRAEMLDAIRDRGFEAIESPGAALDPALRLPLARYDAANEERALREWYAGTLARDRAVALTDLGAAWRADAAVHDEVDLGARIAAERLGIPSASVLVIVAERFLSPELMTERVVALRSDHGLAGAAPEQAVLSPFPRGLRDAPGAFAFRAWDVPRASGEAVYLTLGTVFNAESGDLFPRALAGVREVGAPVVATVGRQIDPAELGPQPAHVRVERWIDQAQVLPGCRAMVSHGGSGSVLGALAHGLPAVLLPIGADQPATAARAADLGTALVLDPVTATPGEIRDAVAEVLGDPSYARAAGNVAEEIRAMPAPGAALARKIGVRHLSCTDFGDRA